MKRKRPRRRWDKYAIKAAVHRRGKSLRQLALDSGLEPSACRVALIRHHAAGEQAIADFLGISPRVLWPERSRPGSDSQKRSTPAGRAAASPNGTES